MRLIFSYLFMVIVLIGQLILSFLFANLLGFLTLTGILYLAYSTPYDLLTLLNWYHQLGIEYKVTIAGSLVTVIGFLVAYVTATLNWKHSLRAQLFINISEEIDQVSKQYLNSLLRLQSHFWNLDSVSREVDHPDGNGVTALRYSFSNGFSADQFHVAIGQTRNMAAENWLLLGRFSPALQGRFLTLRFLEMFLIEANRIIAVPAPIYPIDERIGENVQAFSDIYNREEWARFSREIDDIRESTAIVVGICRSLLTSGVFSSPVHGLFVAVTRRKLIFKVLSVVRDSTLRLRAHHKQSQF